VASDWHTNPEAAAQTLLGLSLLQPGAVRSGVEDLVSERLRLVRAA
jgi:hypothetical protein